jgi:phosphatidylglycerol:prolipoprotein diacylglycerol transferase
VRPIPIVFHLGPLQIHTYGIGLAITFIFATWYLARRFRHAGYPSRWVADAAFWIIGAAMVGARVVHVASKWSFYGSHPGQIPAIWNGGLSSFGGLLFGVPTGLVLLRRACPQVSVARGLDLVAPVLAASWAVGRLLGPQLMIAGGGRSTTAWYGMYYAGSVGRRVPVPIFQAIASFAVFLVLVLIERQIHRRPDGLLIGVAAALWGLSRFFDQFFWLGTPGRIDAVEVAGLALSLTGWILLLYLLLGRGRWRHPRGSGRVRVQPPEPSAGG